MFLFSFETEPNSLKRFLSLAWFRICFAFQGELKVKNQGPNSVCDPMDSSTPGFPVHHQLPELAQTHVRWFGDAIWPSQPLSSPPPPTFNLSQHKGLFRWVSSLHQVAKYWSFSFSISPSNGYSGLISFRMDWLDLLAVQGTLKSFLQHHSSKVSILWHSAFFIVHLSHPYMTTGKTIALTRCTFVGKVVSMLLNILSMLVIAFLPRSKHLLISGMHTDFLGGRSGGLVFPSLEEFSSLLWSTQRLWHNQ